MKIKTIIAAHPKESDKNIYLERIQYLVDNFDVGIISFATRLYIRCAPDAKKEVKDLLQEWYYLVLQKTLDIPNSSPEGGNFFGNHKELLLSELWGAQLN